jgi:hypothetical protein
VTLDAPFSIRGGNGVAEETLAREPTSAPASTVAIRTCFMRRSN